jgi:hypothetical protein
MRLAEHPPPTSRRLTVPEASTVLGITVDAVRGRLKRGTLESIKEEDGTVYVLLGDSQQDTDQSHSKSHLASDQSQLADYMQDQIDYLRGQLEVWQEEARRKDHIIAALTERIPELHPATEPSDARQMPGEGPDGVGDPAPNAEEPERRTSWWRRMFGG